MKYEISSSKDSAAEIKISGVLLDSGGLVDFRESIQDLSDKGIKSIMLDMKDVDMIGSIWLGALLSIHNSLSSEGGGVSMKNCDEHIKDTFRVIGFNKVMNIS